MSNKSNKSGCGCQSEEVAGGVNVPFQRAHGDTWEPEEAPHLKELSERLRQLTQNSSEQGHTLSAGSQGFSKHILLLGTIER